jgi:hypothetical protein
MTFDSSKQPQTSIVPDSTQPARTDDLLASGAGSEDGARGFADQADPSTLQTGMEGIAGATTQDGGKLSSQPGPGTPGTVQDNPGQ